MGEGGRRDNCVCKGGSRLILGFFWLSGKNVLDPCKSFVWKMVFCI